MSDAERKQQQCPYCQGWIDMDDATVDDVHAGAPPYEIECPLCDEVMEVDVEWEPIYTVRKPMTGGNET